MAYPKQKDGKTLEQLVWASRPVKRRGRAVTANLKPISAENRFKGKVDWEKEKERIRVWLREKYSLSSIADKLGVSPSALSKANKIYGLYEPRQKVSEVSFESA